ncbi:hypothetical protein P22_3705 [Propionispora sp. 2/2-37]|uniref:HD-GYP domain-containing protein n=1 Tax=Propionispora sp. 2/2-37 TaxID=1677858 RepID=UPI0006BF0DED|nr:HD-GYP domain-containing protein [Propionispora sp. 2/2-37]CUH97574.1 hypothetical protein P22_3705 [Propionispora sp. 2/2-37]
MPLNQCLLRVEELRYGMIVAQPVVAASGKVLLKQGAFLTERLIRKIAHWQVEYVSIVLPYHVCSAQFTRMYKDTLHSIAATFEKVRTFKEVPLADCRELIDNYVELLVNIVGVVDRLYKVKAHSEYTFRHSLNVAILSGVLGKWLGFKGSDMKDIILAGLLHDIGKAFIPRGILNKPDRLTPEEMALVRKHPVYGYHMLAENGEIPEPVKLAVLQHHEREDGSGYPSALRDEKIHGYAKIVALADVYDAMSSERVYRAKMPPFVVVDTILDEMQEKLNTQICITFLANISRFFVGSSVLLSNGSKATIVKLNDVLRMRPVVQLENGEVLNLADERKIEVVSVLDEIFTAAMS